MEKQHQSNPQLPFIRRLCRHLSEQEVEEAEASFWRYVDIARRIHERVKSEEEAATRFDKS